MWMLTTRARAMAPMTCPPVNMGFPGVLIRGRGSNLGDYLVGRSTSERTRERGMRMLARTEDT